MNIDLSSIQPPNFVTAPNTHQAPILKISPTNQRPLLDPLNQMITDLMKSLMDVDNYKPQLNNLKQRFTSGRLFESTAKLLKRIFKQASKAKKELKNGLELTEHLYTSYYAQELSHMISHLPVIYHILSISGTAIKALSSVTTYAIRIYKNSILNETLGILHNIENDGKEKNATTLEKITKWKNRIQKELESLSTSYVNDLLKAIKSAISCTLLALKYFQLFIVESYNKWSKYFLRQFSYALDFILTQRSRIEALEENHLFLALLKNLDLWKQSHTNKITIDPKNSAIMNSNLSFSTLLDQIVSPKVNYEEELVSLIKSCSNIDQIKEKLRTFDVIIQMDISSKEEFLHFLQAIPAFKQRILDEYTDFQERWEKLSYLISNPDHPLQKQWAISEQAFMRLKPDFEKLLPKLQKMKLSSFKKELQEVKANILNDANRTEAMIKQFLSSKGIDVPAKIQTKEEILTYLDYLEKDPIEHEIIFKAWFFKQSPDDILRAYIDQQHVLMQTLKSILPTIFKYKCDLEGTFSQFKLTEMNVKYGMLVTSFSLSLALGLLTVTASPLTPIGLLALSFMSFVKLLFGIGSMVFSFYLINKYKPSNIGFKSYMTNIQLLVQKLQLTNHKYSLSSLKLKLQQAVTNVHEMNKQPNLDKNSNAYQQAVNHLQKVKKQHDEAKNRVDLKKIEVSNIQHSITSNAQVDLAKFAGLQHHADDQKFDTFKSLAHLLESIDLSLLDNAAVELLEQFFCVNLLETQKKLRKNPNELTKVVNELITASDSKFFDKFK